MAKRKTPPRDPKTGLFLSKGHKSSKSVATKPKARRKASKSTGSGSMRAASSHRRSFRRNPVEGVLSTMKSAAVGAAGSLGVSAVYKRLTFLPESMKSGPLANLGRVLLGFGAGMAIKAVGGKKIAGEVVQGVVTVELAKAGADLAARGGVDLGYWNPGQVIDGLPALGGNLSVVTLPDGSTAYRDETDGAIYLPGDGMGEVMTFSNNGLGEVIDM